MIQHIVLFTPSSELTVEERRAFAQVTLDTLRTSSDIERFTIGRRIEVEAGYDRSFGEKTYGYAAVLEFESRERLTSYLASPAHEELGRLFWTVCGSTIVMEVAVAEGATAVEDLIAMPDA